MKTKDVLVGAVAGAVAGLVTGILVAPDSGKNTRKKIANKVDEAKETLSEIKDQVVKKGHDVAEEIKQRVDEAHAA
ncbi:YtxH domain-containing protein [Sanyastnella coralliicola]|uniref:YtxH domain-containing protein n=1 Tax=Sanyastnella coralliicola TaxID=3069118 RepID=UPI0027BA2828|nr:YtxH domain-containing protein [Longitalea sp. SCSIO 12813]